VSPVVASSTNPRKLKALEICQIYIDGASRGNPGPASIGVHMVDPEGQAVAQISETIGIQTNNVAEYFAFLYALQEALARQVRTLEILTDSQLLARQFSGEYKVKDANIRLLHRLAKRLASYFDSCEVRHIARENNIAADKLANEALDRAM